MTEIKADAASFDTLEDTSGYARPVEDFGPQEISLNHLANLKHLEGMLIKKRRYLAQDVMAYPVVFQTRAMDISKIQVLLTGLREAMEEERILAEKGE